ncbi:MAG: cupredoxin domain-containing protein [Rhodocyclales bacterium]|nr:cupredoxin domain-containing protein [Rhodocyclales bacterium]
MRKIFMAIAVLAGLTFAGLPLQCLAQSVDVGIKDYKYDPSELKVKVGTVVKWVNLEKRTSHSILFAGPGGFESDRIFPGESWQRLFDRPGTYVYTCGPHPEMKGRIEVTE